MEEVDSIIFHFLHQLDVSIPDDVKSLSDLPVEMIVTSASKCLKSINPTLNVPKTLPPGISHRIEVAAQIASMCKDLGYKNEVGYQTFLYCNETDLRKVFMFLIEHLPNETQLNTTISTIPTRNKKSLFLESIGKKISDELNTIWVPQCCYTNAHKTVGDNLILNEHSTKREKTHLTEVELVERLRHLKNQNIFPTMPQVVYEEYKPCTNQIVKSLKELKEETTVSRKELNILETERNGMIAEYTQASKSLEHAEMELKNVLDILNDVGLDHTDMDSVDHLIEKIQKSIGKLHMKSEELTSKNLALKLEIEKCRSQNTTSQSERNHCRNILISLKNAAKSMKDEYDQKEALIDQLKSKYEKVKRGNKRSIYTKRILEIIVNVDKQNLEISKVLEDTRQLQKEINSLEGQLDRCFSVADETLFSDAKKDDQAKKAYKLLALLHSECNTIVNLINDTGMIAREIVDLEDNIKAEKSKRTEDTLHRIQTDLARMQEEANK